MHQPSVGYLAYLSVDFGRFLEQIHHSITCKSIHDHEKYDTLFELAHSVYNLLKHFQTRYTLCIYNEM